MRKSIDNVNHKSVAGAPGADDVFEAVHAAMHLFRSEQYRVLRDGPHDLTHMESKVLGFFARHPDATQSDLAVHSGRDKGQLARLVGGLKERGLLDARPDESDRRNTRLRLTDEGRTVHQTLQRHVRRVAETAVAGMSDDERRRLVALLGRIQANLTAAP